MTSTILTPCRVPWWVSPSTSGVTLTHSESDTEPECSVVLGGGRLGPDGRTDDRRVEIVFESCYFARVGPLPDTAGIEAIGYTVRPTHEDTREDYLDWLRREWTATGLCPSPSFYVAIESPWLQSLPEWYQSEGRHYVIAGRDGYVELIARRFAWREWLWRDGHRDDAPDLGPVVGEGAGVA